MDPFQAEMDIRMKRLEIIIECIAAILTNREKEDYKQELKRLTEFFCASSDVGSDIREIIAALELGLGQRDST